MELVYAALQLGIVGLTLLCARASQPDRNYWPMVRVMFAAIAFIYGGSLTGNLTGGQPHPATRVVFNVAMLLAVGYALWFIRKRNRTPRFIGLDLGGHLTMMTTEEIDHAAMVAESAAHHGVLPPARSATLGAALAEGERKRRWAEDELPRQVAERRARRKGIE